MHIKCSPTWKVTLEHESNRDPTGTTRNGGGLSNRRRIDRGGELEPDRDSGVRRQVGLGRRRPDALPRRRCDRRPRVGPAWTHAEVRGRARMDTEMAADPPPSNLPQPP